MSVASQDSKRSLKYAFRPIAWHPARRWAKSPQYRWNRENYSPARRRLDIWHFAARLLLRLWLDGQRWSYLGGYSEAKRQARRQALAVWIRDSLLALGPTFIKLGQLFSTRGDLLPTEYVTELSKLQDRVPAFDYEQAAAIIEADLGKPVGELFASFEPTPMASASLGQVHKAQLHNGEEVAVKVQRPGLKRLFSIDLAILEQVARYVHNHPQWGRGRDWLGVYHECCRILWQEADYLNEGRNADTFRRHFRGDARVRVPRVCWRYTSLRVLTLEYVPGIKISHHQALDAAGLDRKRLARWGAETYLEQLLNNGFFHADPHPGNLAASPQGELIFYDFGMMGRIESDVRAGLMETLFGISERNAERVMQSLIELGALAPSEDMGPVRRSIQYMLDHFMDQPFEAQSVSEIGDDLYEIAYDQPFRFPATFTFVMRAFSTLEGVGKGLDPDFDIMEVAQPFASDLMARRSSSGNTVFDELGRQAAQASNTALGLPRRLDETIDKLERGDLRVRVRSIESDRILRRLSGIQQGTNYTLIASTLTLSATILLVNGYAILAGVVVVGAAGAGFAFWRLVRRLDRMDRMS
ncbi:MAG: hypothetical protein BRC58_05055 [Cyanobacteria bacterium QS_8_64_29]|nr:MAG: hypothetical protein BRC58_05055 [Cyanobacteria bacterium QS_8_64_29]